MSSDEGAAGALVAAVTAVLRDVPGLSQVSDGAPIQAGDAAAIVDAGPQTDWGFKDGDGAEVRFAVVVSCGGEAPARARLLGEKVRGAVAIVGPELGSWRLVSLAMLRSRVLRSPGPKWTAAVEYRARMMRQTSAG